MKAKLIVEGKEFDIDIFDPELQKLITPKKKTGYERLDKYSNYYAVYDNSMIVGYSETGSDMDDAYYNDANYYSDNILAEDNARADKLMRQLRRFAVEHRVENMRWSDSMQFKHYIVYDCGMSLGVHHCTITREPGVVYFDSIEAATDAIQTFHDELIWYFTEYKDSL